MGYNQNDRLLKMTGPFGESDVLVTSFAGQESISRLFSFRIEFLSTKLDMKAADLVGKSVTLEVQRFDDQGSEIGVRYFNGFVNRLRAGDVHVDDEGAVDGRGYQIEIVPWMWFLTQTARCFIYVDRSVKEIIEDVLARPNAEYHVQAKVDSSAISSLGSRKLEQCVQYRETDFNFLSRLFEQYGVYYYFTHEADGHKLVLGMKTNYPKCEEFDVQFPGNFGHVTDNCINSWEHGYEFTPGKWTHTDYDFKKPLTNMDTNSPKISGSMAPDSASYEVYDYPGEYIERSDGSDESRIRQEESEIPHNTVTGSSSCKSFIAGHKFKLKVDADSPAPESEAGEYLITTISHSGSQQYYSQGTTHYSNNFSCMPASIMYRPRRLTPKPVISGVQTGVVIGPQGEEIHTDEYGRVQVIFHWDREGRAEHPQNRSCWIRCAQSMAGRKWGFMAIPRIGQEVVIEFLEGDPDRPLIVGGVYNQDQMPHYDPREHKTRTYFKTNSSKGGEGFNELMFEDLAGKEMVFTHAQKDMETRVLNDSRERIFGNRHQIIGWEKDGKKGGDQSEVVWQDKHLNIKRDHQEHIEGNMFLAVGFGDAEDPGNGHFMFEKAFFRQVGLDGAHFVTEGSESRSIGQNLSVAVSGNQSESVGGDSHMAVTGDFIVTSKNMSTETDMNIDTKAGMNCGVEAGMNMHLKSGLNLIIESGVKLSLKVGGSFVDISPAGVAISGPMVMINSGGAAGSGHGISTKSPEGPEAPKPATKSSPKETEIAHEEKTGQKSCK